MVNNELLPGILVVNQAANKIYLSWTSINPADIGTGTLLEYRFSADPGVSANLTWDTLVPGNCEYADINATIITSFYVNATVFISPAPDQILAGYTL